MAQRARSSPPHRDHVVVWGHRAVPLLVWPRRRPARSVGIPAVPLHHGRPAPCGRLSPSNRSCTIRPHWLAHPVKPYCGAWVLPEPQPWGIDVHPFSYYSGLFDVERCVNEPYCQWMTLPPWRVRRRCSSLNARRSGECWENEPSTNSFDTDLEYFVKPTIAIGRPELHGDACRRFTPIPAATLRGCWSVPWKFHGNP